MMFFGLINSPASFQSYINKILAEKNDIFIIVCLNNIFIYIKDQGQDHAKVIWLVSKALKKYGFYANLNKYCFHQNKIRFPGYVNFTDGIWIKKKNQTRQKMT